MAPTDDGDNPLKSLRADIERGAPERKVAKANHTLYLSEEQYGQFRAYCGHKGVKPSAVVDRLISMFLAEVKDDLPPPK